MAIDKITVVPAAKIGEAIGYAGDALLLRVNQALALFLGTVLFTPNKYELITNLT